jgi:hypothetical protein
VLEGLGEVIEVVFSTDELGWVYWKVGLWKHGVALLTELTKLKV